MPYSELTKRSRMDQITSVAGAAAKLQIIAAGSPVVVLVEFTLNTPMAGPATGVEGILTLNGFPKTANASATGTAAFARIRTAGGTDVVFGMTVGTTDAHDVTLSTVSITSGGAVTLNSATIQHANIPIQTVIPGNASGTNLSGMEIVNWAGTGGSQAPVGWASKQDIFTDLNNWFTWADPSCSSVASGGELVQTIQATANGYTGTDSSTASTLLGSSVYVRLVQVVQGTGFSGLGIEVAFQAVQADDGNRRVFFAWTSDGNLKCVRCNDGVTEVTVATATYNATNHKWLRFRETNGTFYFETAPDGVNNLPGAWTVFGSVATNLITWNLSNALVGFYTGRWGTMGTISGPTKWDGLNTATDYYVPLTSPATPARSNSQTLQNIDSSTPRDEDIAYLASNNFYKNRLPIRWELLQPILPSSAASANVRGAFSPAVSSNGQFYTAYRDRITSVLDAHAAVGSKCIIALKNGCRYVDFVYDINGNVVSLVAGTSTRQPYTTSGLGVERIFGGSGSSALPTTDFADFWTRVASYWGNNWNGTGLPHPGLGGYSLMDQAYDLGGSPESLTIWPTYAAAAITGIRQFDLNTPIYVCGNDHSYAPNWVSKNPNFPLSSNNLVYEARQFLDYPGTGYGFDWAHESANGATTSSGVNGITPFVAWCQSHSVKGAVSETGLPLDGTSDSAQNNWNTSFQNLLNYLAANNIEAFTWAGGNHYQAHGAPNTHVPQFYEGRSLEPLVAGLMKKAYGTAKATLWDSGASYWDPAAGGGSAIKIGCNVHSGWYTAGQNQLAADILHARNIKVARMDLIIGDDHTWVRDFINRHKAYGGTVEMVVTTSYHSDHTVYTGGALATVEADSYDQTYSLVDEMCDLVNDFEMLNEVSFRSEITAQTPQGSGQNETAYYTGGNPATPKTSTASIAAVLRGMSDAIADVAAARGKPLRRILGAFDRDWGFLEAMETLGVSFDVVGWHFYGYLAQTAVVSDTYYGTGGPMNQIATRWPGKPCVVNEFNAFEIYNGSYGNAEGNTLTEEGYGAVAKHLRSFYNQSTAPLESVTFYELVDHMEWGGTPPMGIGPEARFGLHYSLSSSTPKHTIYLAAAFAGGTLSGAETNEITVERSLVTTGEINTWKANAGGGGGAALTITVGARGYISSNITLSVSSNAGGTFTGTPVTLTAGANPTATFTFKPAGADLETTLTYAITSGGQTGMQPPPPRKIYSYANPVALQTTNLPMAGKTLLAKYNASLWEASNGYQDYMGGTAVATTNGQAIRAICDSIKGTFDTAKNPQCLLSWTNPDNNYGSQQPPIRGTVNGKPYASFDGNLPLWMRKSLPIANINPNPMNRMPFHLADQHFMIATVSVDTGGSGTVIEASSHDAGNSSKIIIDSSRVPKAVMGSATVSGSAMVANQAYTLTLLSKTGASGQKFRVDNVEVGTPGNSTHGTQKFNQILVGGGYSSYTPSFSSKLRVFAAAVGAGNPSANELTVMEKYLASMGASGTGQPTGGGIPFGSRADGPYLYGGTITTKTQAQMDTWCKGRYDAWKAARIVSAPGVSGGLAVRFNEAASPAVLYVSEGMGYGMILAAMFAGYDSGAQALFDGLLKTARQNFAYSIVNYGQPKGRYMMEWRIALDGSSMGGGWGACDGDLDMAYALLMAHRQWGSNGTWNYLAEAQLTIDALKDIAFKPDGTSMGLSTPHVSRVSDYMFGHFRAFGAAMNDNAFWVNTVIPRMVWLSERMQTVYSVGVGLVPDFIVATDTATPYPSPGYMGDGNANEDKYYWNNNRVPFRWAADYVWSGDADVIRILNRITAFIHSQSSSGTTIYPNLHSGYALNGAYVTNDWPNPAFVGPWGAGAMCNTASYQTLANSCWAWCESNPTAGYYDAECTLLGLLVMSGNWWRP